MCSLPRCGGREERRKEGREKAERGREVVGREEGGRNPPYFSTVQGKYTVCHLSNKNQLNYVLGFSYKVVIFKVPQNMWILNLRSISKIKIQNKPSEVSWPNNKPKEPQGSALPIHARLEDRNTSRDQVCANVQ